ncbi:MAG TPA: carbohydrate binding domain-containing protein, partial [Acidimicrobiales bacterium]
SLIHGPAMTQPRDVSLHQGQTAFNWDTGPGLSIGRVPSNPAFNPAVLTVSSGNLAVLPAANVRPWFPGLGVSAFSAQIQARAKTAPAPAPTTGRSDATAVVTDPTTGATTSRTFTVTLNAGNSFNNGDFERNQAGWANTWFSDEKIKVHNEGSTYDGDKALFLSKGGAAYRVTGLEPNTQYILRGRARGTGSSLQAYQPGTDPAAMWSPGPLLAEAPVTDRTQWVTYQVSFWTPSVDNSGTPLVDESREVWITLWDVNANDGANTEPWACDTAWPTNYLTGATCFDDIGFFKFGDNP